MNTYKKATIMAAGTAALVMAGAGAASAQADADGAAVDSPGVLSGNNIQIPVHIPINLCGNTVDIIAALNPTFGNTCLNIDGDDDHDEHHEGHEGHKGGDSGGHHG
ncbi:chaplin [Embleya sp. NPDC008237]|uniref:chaplin n=1 Tax=unclassified Embleya TaxID=2699296 RepID=UPI0036E313FD